MLRTVKQREKFIHRWTKYAKATEVAPYAGFVLKNTK